MICPVCSNTAEFYTKIKGNINIPGDTNVYELHKCVECEHIFRTNLLDKNIYDDTYYAYSASESKLTNIFMWFFIHQRTFPINLIWAFIQNFSRYQNMPFLKDGAILDVGGGDGFALNFYKKLNNKTYNTEILEWVVESSKKNGHETYRDLNEINGVQFDLIRINQVLEHVTDPKYFMKNCYRLLKPEGKIVIGIPNIRSLGYELLKDNFDQLSLPDHIHFFSEKSLRLLLSDFKNVTINYPLHKYGVVSNTYKLWVIKYKLPNNIVASTMVNLLGIPVNILAKALKKTHLIDIICYK